MTLPELPAPFKWIGTKCIDAPDEEGEYENVAWYWPPGQAENSGERYLVYSAPVGVEDKNWLVTYADTEEEAINLIATFALLGVTKDG